MFTTIFTIIAAASTAHNDQLADIRTAHRHSREAIQTLHAVVKIDGIIERGAKLSSPVTHRAEWWQDGDTIRCRYLFSNSKLKMDEPVQSDWLLRNGQEKHYEYQAPHGSSPNRSGVISAAKGLRTFVNPWHRALFVIDENANLPFDRAVTDTSRVTRIESTKYKGRPATLIECTPAGNEKLRLWFDPQVNYLIRKQVTLPDNGDESTRVEQEVLKYREHSPGVFFPETAEQRVYFKGKLNLMNTIKFEHVWINQPIDPSVLSLPFPEGTLVADKVTGVSYIAGPDGEPSTQPIPLPPPVEQAYATGHRPSSESWLFVPVAASVLLTLTVLGWRIRARRKRGSA